MVPYIVSNVSSRDIRHFDPDPGFNENVENHEFPRFGNFVRPNGPDTGSRKLRNVFPVVMTMNELVNTIVMAVAMFVCGWWGGVKWTPRGGTIEVFVYKSGIRYHARGCASTLLSEKGIESEYLRSHCREKQKPVPL